MRLPTSLLRSTVRPTRITDPPTAATCYTPSKLPQRIGHLAYECNDFAASTARAHWANDLVGSPPSASRRRPILPTHLAAYVRHQGQDRQGYGPHLRTQRPAFQSRFRRGKFRAGNGAHFCPRMAHPTCAIVLEETDLLAVHLPVLDAPHSGRSDRLSDFLKAVGPLRSRQRQ